jgi:hypothetical protein
LSRFLLQRSRRQYFGVEVIGSPELHFHVEVDDIAITDANGVAVGAAVDEDVHGVHHILEGWLGPKSDDKRVCTNLSNLMHLYSRCTDTK